MTAQRHLGYGRPNDLGAGKDKVRITLVDFMDTTVEKLRAVQHKGGNFKCSECDRLIRSGF